VSAAGQGLHGEEVASSANVLKADLMRVLPARRVERSRSELSLAACPARPTLNATDSETPCIDLDQAQVSILDSDATLSQALARTLQAEGFSARAAASERDLIAPSDPSNGGCLIADATRWGMNSLELQGEVATGTWALPVIFLTSPGDTKTVVRLMRAGAFNCLTKPVEPGELVEAVREAIAESHALCAQRAAQLRVRQMLERLTPREREVLDLALDGLLVKQIAARLGTAEKTIKTHKGRLMRKMEVRSTLALVQLMITTGISLRATTAEAVPST
jgi:RNA polymerase sigma factor (sigma-70 family)